jgi:hypothetical protein
MVLPIRHRQGFRRAFGLAAATRADCHPVLNQADLGVLARDVILLLFEVCLPPSELFGNRFQVLRVSSTSTVTDFLRLRGKECR